MLEVVKKINEIRITIVRQVNVSLRPTFIFFFFVDDFVFFKELRLL